MDGGHHEAGPAEGKVDVEAVEQVGAPEPPGPGEGASHAPGLGHEDRGDRGRQLAEPGRMDGGGEAGIHAGAEGGQQLPDVGTDPSSPGIQREGVEQEERRRAGHRAMVGNRSVPEWRRPPLPMGEVPVRAMSDNPMEMPAMMIGATVGPPIQKMSKSPST
jgi:hypothetical protein